MANIQGLLEKYKNKEGERFFAELFEKGEYEAILNRKLDVVVDVGALAGEFGAYIYDKAGVIHCIEPFEPHFDELYKNIEEFQLTKMLPYRFAVYDYNGECRMSTSSARGGNSITNNKEETQPTPCYTLARFIELNEIKHIDLLKIDIENTEVQVFGSKDFKDVVDRIDCIIGEHLGGEAGETLLSYGFKRTQHMNNLIYERE